MTRGATSESPLRPHVSQLHLAPHPTRHHPSRRCRRMASRPQGDSVRGQWSPTSGTGPARRGPRTMSYPRRSRSRWPRGGQVDRSPKASDCRPTRKNSRPPRSADDVRAGHQPQDRQSSRPDDSSTVGLGDRVRPRECRRRFTSADDQPMMTIVTHVHLKEGAGRDGTLRAHSSSGREKRQLGGRQLLRQSDSKQTSRRRHVEDSRSLGGLAPYPQFRGPAAGAGRLENGPAEHCWHESWLM